MKELVKNKKLCTALLSIVVGILFCIFKGSILGWIMTVLGVLFIVLGILDILAKREVNGIIEIVIGVAIIVCGWTIVNIVLLVVGILLIVWGIFSIKDIKKNNLLSILKVLGLVALGVMLVVNNFAAVDWFFIIIGVLSILYGILLLLDSRK